MSSGKKDSWNDWNQKRNDWNLSNSSKLGIHKELSCGPSSSSKFVSQTASRMTPLKGSTLRRTNSLPNNSSVSPLKDSRGVFLDVAQEELDAMEAKALADAVDAVELEIARRNLKTVPDLQNDPSTSKHNPPFVHHGNNGSSGFEVLFGEDLADDVVDQCMLLASQEIQANQNQNAQSQAYNVFSKGIDFHSSVYETTATFKKPFGVAQSSSLFAKPGVENSSGTGTRVKSSSKAQVSPSKSSSGSVSALLNNKSGVNPQAEAEIRRLSIAQEQVLVENKNLKELLRSKEGEASILRSRLKKAASDAAQQKTVSDKSVSASRQQYGNKLREMEKQILSLQSKLQFQEAETSTAKERLKLLSQASPRVKLVEPSTSMLIIPPTTPQRANPKKHSSSFLNRSTFEDKPPRKRTRLDEEYADDKGSFGPEVNEINMETDDVCLKPEMRSSETQTIVEKDELDDITWMQEPVTLSVGERLSEKLTGLQLVSDEADQQLITNRDSDFRLQSNSMKRKCILNEKKRPQLKNCAENLQWLMTWKDSVLNCDTGKTVLLQVIQECCGIVHYHLLLLQYFDDCRGEEQLRERDQGPELLPLNTKFDLLNEKPWYKDEFAVEVRRSLGILSELAAVSHFAALLLTGQGEVGIPKHKFYELPEFAEISSSQNSTNDKGKQWFLEVLLNISSRVVRQKCTTALSGVLAGVLCLLKECARQQAIRDESESLILSIIKEIILTRPPSFVILQLVELLVHSTHCDEIMKGLCTNCDADDCVEDNFAGVCTFTRNACALQLLCVQLKTVIEPYRWRLVDQLVRWLCLVLAQGWRAPTWILSSPHSSHEACCTQLVSTVVRLLWDTFETFQSVEEGDILRNNSNLLGVHEAESDRDLVRIMKRAIALFHGLLANNMCGYMADVEGCYELLLRGLSQSRGRLNLTPALERELEVLLRVEQEATVTGCETPVVDQQGTWYWDFSLSLLNFSP